MSYKPKYKSVRVLDPQCGVCMDSMLAAGLTKGQTCPICSPYRWPTDASGQRLPKGDCSSCKQIDKRHPEGAACDFSCVGM